MPNKYLKNEQRKDEMHAININEMTLVPCQSPRCPYDSDKALELEELTGFVRESDRQIQESQNLCGVL